MTESSTSGFLLTVRLPVCSFPQAHTGRQGARPGSPRGRANRDKNDFSFSLSFGTTPMFSVEGNESPP